mgnify:CR=1 FL=1
MMQNKGKIYVKKFIILLFWLGVWQILAMCVDNFLLVVTPLQALQALLTLAGQVEFWRTVQEAEEKLRQMIDQMIADGDITQ